MSGINYTKTTTDFLISNSDNNMGNALFQVKNKKVVSVALVDYGGAYNVAQGVKKEVVVRLITKLKLGILIGC